MTVSVTQAHHYGRWAAIVYQQKMTEQVVWSLHLKYQALKTTVAKVFEQAVGPGVLQTFSTCAVQH